jgi:hypothetical protein
MAYSSITKPTDYFNTVLWAGNSDTTRNITGVGFQPDWVWVKNRSLASDHRVANAVRGANKGLVPNGTDAEDSSTTAVKSFLSNGIQVGNEQSFNRNGDNHVGWFWKANGAGSSNTDGSITSTVSANTTAGFSIVTYSGNATAGATVGHGLGAVPKMLIVRKYNTTKDWNVYHNSIGATKGMYVNLTNAEQTHTNWNNTTPTSTVFSIGSDDQVNGSSGNYIAYCFAEKKGYSKFGGYTGNGNADGVFVYTGFKPAFILARRTDATDNWVMYDNKRSGYNPQNDRLYPNGNFAEEGTTDKMFDMLSNGFKARATWSTINASGGSYIYMAFAEQPLVANVNGGLPATAR